VQSIPPLTPEEAAQILKVSKYTLYEMIKRGELPAQRIGRQIRIDPEVLTRYLKSDQAPELVSPQPKVADQGLRFVGSHDPAMELLIEFLQLSACPIIPSYKGSMDGLIALYNGEADFAGVHLWDDKTEDYNLPFVEYILPGESTQVINLVQRVQGWIVPKGNPLGLCGWQDLEKKFHLVNRQKGSGTRLRLDAFLRRAGISPTAIKGYDQEETTHFGVAFRVANGQADAGIGVQAAAVRLGLDFIPLYTERYDLVALLKTTTGEPWQQLKNMLSSPAFLNSVHTHSGYDTSLTGQTIKVFN
jgi:putative molybdopterin biosynthesis protein